MRVISIDPGRLTGYCYAEIADGKLTYHPFQSSDDVDDMWRRLSKFQPRHIVIEDFEFRKGSQRGGLDLFPQQMIGVARLYSLIAHHQCACKIQKAAQGKGYFTDAVLKQMNLHRRGLPHGMDASRHLLQWFTFGQGYQYASGNAGDIVIAERMEWWT